MSWINAIVGSACGAVFLCDWLIARSKSPRSLQNAAKRAQKKNITDKGYHPMPSDEATPIQATIMGMNRNDLFKLKNSLLLIVPIGALLGYLGTLVAEYGLARLPGVWSFFFVTGCLVGLGFPAFLQIWALSMDIVCWVRTGKGPMGNSLSDAMIETLDISVHEHQMFNPSLYTMFILSGCGCGGVFGAGRLIYLQS